MITRNEYELTTIDIDNCYYSIKLKNDENLYNVWSKKDKDTKRKIYFIKKDGKEIMLDDEVKKWYSTEVGVYERCGI